MYRERLKRLAESIDALADKDDQLLARGREIAELRRRAAAELHSVCGAFATELNVLLSRCEVQLDPPAYAPADFREDSPNLFQINVRGRIVQVEFEATPELVSTEEFRVPYTLAGAIRCFNQPLLEQHMIDEHLLFYCLESGRQMWRFFDARTYRSGVFDVGYLISLMEKLV